MACNVIVGMAPARSHVDNVGDADRVLVELGSDVQLELIPPNIVGVYSDLQAPADVVVAVPAVRVAWLGVGQVGRVAARCRDLVPVELTTPLVDVGDPPLGKVGVGTASTSAIVHKLEQRLRREIESASSSHVDVG